MSGTAEGFGRRNYRSFLREQSRAPSGIHRRARTSLHRRTRPTGIPSAQQFEEIEKENPHQSESLGEADRMRERPGAPPRRPGSHGMSLQTYSRAGNPRDPYTRP